MEDLKDLCWWAKDRGVGLNGITPQRTPGRGVGVVATRKLKAGEIILTVPTKAIYSFDTISENIYRKLHPAVSLHGLLAVSLALDKTITSTPWNAVFPTWAEFEAGTPLLWPEELQNLLPNAAKDLLRMQQVKFEREWDIITKTFPHIRWREYMYTWLIVNTRSFYYVTPKMERFSHKDKMALLPIADLLNHADSGCQVSFFPESFTVITDRAYHASEEVYVCYGKHSNDFLLTEYGFVLAENRWDEVSLDDVILPYVSTSQKVELEDGGFLGNYMLDARTAGCYRTQVVLRLLCCTRRQWCSFVVAEDDGESSQAEVDSLLIKLLDRFLQTISETVANIEKLNVGLDTQRELLVERWKQINTIIMHAIKCLQC